MFSPTHMFSCFLFAPSPQDVRRLVVAMSRARLGLYVFGRFELFNNCFELQPTFSQLAQRPLKLQVLPDERFGEVQRAVEDRGAGVKTIGMWERGVSEVPCVCIVHHECCGPHRNIGGAGRHCG